jgi:hypothetical protein
MIADHFILVITDLGETPPYKGTTDIRAKMHAKEF